MLVLRILGIGVEIEDSLYTADLEVAQGGRGHGLVKDGRFIEVEVRKSSELDAVKGMR